MLAKNYSNLAEFGTNPGELSAKYYLPKQQANALIVLLHGCTQNGVELAKDSGLLFHAQINNLALLVPQQSQNNNIQSCFNWFSPQDITKDEGETLSLKQMIEKTSQLAGTSDIFIVGLSAGGAMATNLLVHYPSLFKGGASVAGVPFPCADSLIKAISCMKTGPSSSVEELASAIKTNKNNTIPKLSIWTGNEDQIVHPSNSSYMAKQWAKAYQLSMSPKTSTQYGSLSQWKSSDGETQIELIELDNFGHGLAVTDIGNGGGTAAPYLLKTSIGTVNKLMDYWKLKKTKI